MEGPIMLNAGAARRLGDCLARFNKYPAQIPADCAAMKGRRAAARAACNVRETASANSLLLRRNPLH